ncbi:E3 ubiquitin-protein ligase rnf213-alpha-like, partial [Mizuhopecten yessoensis]|uniref:E3 ubiquitin-protein ligase rnf213-alpha-like n=1 Tax=Mizuhopecten yessoensis TaxID=6573 RepID=UPI000B4592D7
MVKCQGLKDDGGPCGVDLLPDVRFCPECGTRVHKVTILDKPKDTVACPGTDEGNPCNKELVQGPKFCISCGWRVNQSIFEPGSRVCGADSQGTRCTGVIRKQETTCPICTSDKGAAPTAVQKDHVRSADSSKSADSKSVDQTQTQSQHEETLTEQHSQKSEPPFTDPGSQSTGRTETRETAGKPGTEQHSQNSEPPFPDPGSQSTGKIETSETTGKPGTEQHSQKSEPPFPDPGPQLTGRTETSETTGKPGTEQHSQKSEPPFTDPRSQLTGRTETSETTGKPGTEQHSQKSEPPFTDPRSQLTGRTETSETTGKPGTEQSTSNKSGKQISQHSAGQNPQTSGAKLKVLFSEGGEAGGSSGEIKNKAQHGDICGGITEPPNQGDNTGSTVKNQLAPEVQGSTSDQTSQSTGAKLNILYGDGNDKAVAEVNSDEGNDCYNPKQVSDKFQSSLNILQKNEKSDEDQYGESQKRKDNDGHHGDTWQPPTFSLLGHEVHTLPGLTPKGDAAASVVKAKPSPGLNEDGITESGDGPTQKPVPVKDGQGESATASVPSGPILQRTAEGNSSADTGSSQKGIFNFTGSSRQKSSAGVWQNPDERFREVSKTVEIKDDELYGDGSPLAETAEELKPVGEALRELSLFSSVNDSKQESTHTSSKESSKDVDKDPNIQDTASVVSRSDEESGSSNDEDDNEDDNSLNQNEGDSQKKKNKDKNNSSTKSKREKKKARKKRKEEERKKEKTDDNPFTQYKKEKGQNHGEGSTSGRTDPGSSTRTTDSVSSNLPSEKRPSTRTRSDCIKVVFHAVFSPSLLNDADAEGGAYLCLSQNDSQIKMDIVKQFNDGSVEFTAEYPLLRYHVEKRINYTYCVDTSPGHHQFAAELFYDSASPNGNIGRFLSVPKKSLSSGSWHQFDGFVYGKQESSFVDVVKKVFGIDDHMKIMKDDADKIVKHQFEKLLFDLRTQVMTPEEFFDMLQCMLQGLNYVYITRGRIWYSTHDFHVFAGKIFRQSIMTFVQQITSQGLDLPEHLRLGVIISLINVIMCMAPFDEKNEKDMETLCLLLQLQPSDEKSLKKTIEELKTLFPNKLRAVTNTLQLMSNFIAGHTGNTCWLLVVPVLHFLWGKNSPFQRPSTEIGHSERVPVWWGVDEYKSKQEYFAGKSSWNLSMLELLPKLAPLFEVDYLLPRTLMTVVKLANMPDVVRSRLFSPDLCVAKLYYHVKSNFIGMAEHKIVQDILDEIYQQVIEKGNKEQNGDAVLKETREHIQVDMYRLYAIGVDLLRAVLENSSKTAATVTRVAKVLLQALALFKELKENREGANTRSGSRKYVHDSLAVFYDVRERLTRFLTNSCTSMNDPTKCRDSLLVWDQILCITMSSKTLQEGFQRVVIEELEKRLATKNFDVILTVYCEHLEKFGSVVQDILSTMAFKALEKGSIISTYGSRSQDEVKKRYAKLLSSVFEKYWREMTEEQMFQEALKWTPFVHFVDMFYLEEQGKHLSNDSGLQLTKATTAIEDRMGQLVNGTILVKDHSVICANFERFEKLIRLMSKKNNSKMGPTYIRQLVDLRSKELQAFLNAYGLVTVLIDMCSRFGVKREALERRYRSLQNLDDVQMVQLCKPGVLDDMMHPNEYQPVVTAFELSPEELDLIPQMKHCFNSTVFTTKWDSTGQKVARQREEMLSIAETFEHVWQPSIVWWTSVKTKLKEGSMTFQEFSKLFGNMDSPTLEREFSLMDENGPWIKERTDEIQLYRNLAKCVEGAKIILQVVDKYDLKGDFTPIKLITSVMSGTDIAMNTLDQSLKQTCAVLRGVDERHIECLKEFIKCDPLILWLKESMPSGLKELKVFVDLASISAGEGDIEIDKVRCLHSATTGYAPLIFNLTDDIGYKDFLKKCEMVWKELDADPNLPKKLRDTNRQIEWLKTVKKAHGSVEVTSLAQTAAINSVGIYQVGRLPDQKWEQKPELKDVISLHVSEDENGARQRKLYHYDQLHDLQSRLMLVAGKAEMGKEDVDRFTLILDSVVRLANTYIKLVSSGCVLFSEWKVKFLCDRTRKACSFITFGMGDQLNTLKGRKANEDDDVSSIVPRIAKFMEKCYEEWLKYIADKRDKYYELNYLTIDQMVILQRELVKVGTDEEPSKLIFPLLSGIKKDCSMSDLISAMKAAQREVESMDELRVEEKSETSSEAEIEEGEEEAVFIREVMKTGYSEELAKKALHHFKADEIDDAVVWCMDHEEDDDTDEAMDILEDMDEGGKEPPTEEYKGWTDTHMSISTVTSELLATLEHINELVRVDPLIKDLEKLWERFLTSISSSVSDYLSVEHLGLVLRYLAGKESFGVKRFLIQSFKEGVPNLIICPQNDILNTVLTIYMNDGQQPLPQPDEVLICSSHTTLDQLDIFWRRAVFNQSGKIYCLANSDLLDYEVSDKGEQCLERHMQTAKEK